MQNDELRQAVRVRRLFLTSYVNLDDRGPKTPVSVGRTLNVSKTGVGMEVFQKVEAGSVMDLEFDVKGSILTVMGKVIHVHPADEGGFVIGIEFDEPQKMFEGSQAG